MKRKKKSDLQKRKDNGSSRYWKIRADAQWRQVVLERDGDACVVCGADCPEVHHLITRARIALRHLVENGLCLCADHHKWNRYISAHTAPIAFADWMAEHRPGQMLWVRNHQHTVHTGPKPDYRQRFIDLGGTDV